MKKTGEDVTVYEEYEEYENGFYRIMWYYKKTKENKSGKTKKILIKKWYDNTPFPFHLQNFK